MAQIFISYRRNDTAYLAATLSDKLQEHFGPHSVFFDIDNIPLGVDFREYIGSAVGQCDVLLAIIGDQWMGGGEKSEGKRRIDDASDYVRIEIESALKRNIPVIPVLVDEATMPSPSELPSSMESMAFRNAAEIRAGRDFRQHIEQLIRGLETVMKSSSRDPKRMSDEGSTPEKSSSQPAEKRRPSKAPPTKLRKFVEDRDKSLRKADDSALLQEIQKVLKGFTDTHVYLGPSLPPDKVANAISTYAPGVLAKDVLLFFDNTVFGGAKDGLLLTGEAVYWRNIAGKSSRVSYADIENADFRETKSLFTSAKIQINQDEIEVNVADQVTGSPYLNCVNNLGQTLTNVILHLTEHLKR